MTDPYQPNSNQRDPNQRNPNQPNSNDRERFIGAPRQGNGRYRHGNQVPDELAGGLEVKKRGWNLARAVVAVLIALAMVLAGVVVGVAVLSGPQVRADAPLDPATPAGRTPGGGQTASPLPGEPIGVPDLDGTTFTIPVQDSEGESILFEVSAYGRFDSRKGETIHGYYPWLTDGVLHTVVEGTATHDAADSLILSDEFQEFIRTTSGEYVRAETTIVNEDPYGYVRIEPGEVAVVAILFPTKDDEEPEAVGIALGTNWYDSATWLELDGLPEVDYTSGG